VWVDFAIFDLHILKRPNAHSDYSKDVKAEAKAKFEQMSEEELEELKNTALLGLPGSNEAFHIENFQQLLDQYQTIGAKELEENLHYFIQSIAPFAENLGINLCIHPDDPPFPLLGLPRVVSTEKNLSDLMDACPTQANGITFCTGSLGVRADNDLPKMIRKFADRIHFIHLRATKREQEEPLIFHEADHLTGDVPMVEVIKEICLIEKNLNKQLPMRPDHGHQMLDDLQKKTYPGYTGIGRLKGLAELRGVELAVKSMLCLLFFLSFGLKADDGYRLWLKFNKSAFAKNYQQLDNRIQNQFPENEIIQTAKKELIDGINGLLGHTGAHPGSKKIVFVKNNSIKNQGYQIKVSANELRIEASEANGILYGVFGLLRQMQQGQTLHDENSNPKIQLRMLNHWDNVLGTIERGYAGSSLWKWYELPETIDPRYTDYARANASIGINAVAVNNVNASARFLTAEYLSKVKALADVFRPYGIKLYLSLNFASPKILGKLKTSDPLDPQVRNWWKEKTKEIHQFIPDFGGFLIKANSEGEPGPQEYGRTHADGANMLAEAIAPFGGKVIWRAFVYSPNPNGDRFKEAFNEFKPLDGIFAKNVIVQVKNGPIDFQPREPFHPLFGAMPKTPLGLEFQITQEYLGFSTNLFYQSILFKETLDADTYSKGKGSTVAKEISMIAGVANTGSDRNWTGHLMSQANWYAFGRLAWDYDLTSEQIAKEWTQMSLTHQPKSVEIIENLLMKSRETYVNFTTPLGLHHIMGQSIHFGPEPWLTRSQRPDWTSIYYHRADSVGLGFNRKASGSNALSLYHPEVQKRWADPANTDLNFLLWFHHIPWNEKLSSGRTLWNELCYRYYSGVEEVKQMQTDWDNVKGTVDEEIFKDVKGRLAVQHREALNWRDACVLYFQTFSKQPIPYEAPKRSLEEMKKIVEIYQLK
jgi:alpha-glucuronidase